MKIEIRTLSLHEYQYITDLCEAEKALPFLADAFTPLWWAVPDGVPNKHWAILYEGKVVGGAGYLRAESDPMLALIALIVAPPYRGQGIGSEVYTRLVEAVGSKGVKRLMTKVYSHQLAGLRFLTRRGFIETGATLPCQLNVAAANLTQWENPDQLLAQQGLRFTTLDRLPRHNLAERLLPIWNRTRPDQPQDWPFVPYSVGRFARELIDTDELALQHSFAILTGENRIVAINFNTYDRQPLYPHLPETNTNAPTLQRLFTVYSAVDPDFRQRKLGLALKLKLIAHAQAHGIDFLAAENDARNGAMVGINRKVGYRSLGELVHVTRFDIFQPVS